MKVRKINDEVLLEMVKQDKLQKEMAEYFGCSIAAISKRLQRLSLPESFKKLTGKQQVFVTEVADGKTQTQAAAAAYGVSSRESAKAMGSQLMKHPDIEAAITEIMQEEGLTRRYRVQKLKTHVDAIDPHVSLKALDQSWKLDGYVEKHINLNIDVKQTRKDIADLDSEIERLETSIGLTPSTKGSYDSKT